MVFFDKLKKLLSLLLSVAIVQPNLPTTPIPTVIETTTPGSNVGNQGILRWTSLDKVDPSSLVEGGSIGGRGLFVARGTLGSHYVPGWYDVIHRQTVFVFKGRVTPQSDARGTQLLQASPGALVWINMLKNSSLDPGAILVGGSHPDTGGVLGICRSTVDGNLLIGYFDVTTRTCHLAKETYEATHTKYELLVKTEYGKTIAEGFNG